LTLLAQANCGGAAEGGTLKMLEELLYITGNHAFSKLAKGNTSALALTSFPSAPPQAAPRECLQKVSTKRRAK